MPTKDVEKKKIDAKKAEATEKEKKAEAKRRDLDEGGGGAPDNSGSSGS